jgi:hypothetical protein
MVKTYAFGSVPSTQNHRQTFFVNQLAAIASSPKHNEHRQRLVQNLVRWVEQEMDRMYHIHCVYHTCLTGDLHGAEKIVAKMVTTYLSCLASL